MTRLIVDRLELPRATEVSCVADTGNNGNGIVFLQLERTLARLAPGRPGARGLHRVQQVDQVGIRSGGAVMSAAAPAPQATPTPTATGTTPTDPTAVLAELFRAGDLAREDQVRDLLAELPDDQLERAGRLLDRVGADAVLAAHPDTPLVPVVVTGHGTVAPLVPLLTAQLARHGLLLRARVGDFGGYLDELAGADGTELVLALLDPQLVFDQVPLPWQPEDVARTFAAKIDLIERLRPTRPRRWCSTPSRCPAPSPPNWSTTGPGRHSARCGGRPTPGCCGCRSATIGGGAGPRSVGGGRDRGPRRPAERVRPRPPVPRAAARLRPRVGHLARGPYGRHQKVLALDLDDTVWGGVLGEVGPDGMQVAETYRGEAFRAFQRVVKQLGAQGVLVAAVSKNDPGPVRTTLRDHPDMTLREDDFVRVVANWRPKHENLRDLAADLNVGLGQLWCSSTTTRSNGAWSAANCPSVAVVAVHDEPARSRRAAAARRVVRHARADRRGPGPRPQRYREDGERRDFLHTFDSLRDYLARTGLGCGVGPPLRPTCPASRS